MTPFTHPTIDTHIRVYNDRIKTDIHRAIGTSNPVRTAIARGLVRTGAWLLPDKPYMVGNTVIVLPPPSDSPEQVAA